MGFVGTNSLVESLKDWHPKELFLHLYECKIDTSGCIKLLKALSDINLVKLDISENPIEGAFAELDPGLDYPFLRDYEMRSTPLTSGDLLALKDMIKTNKLPDLQNLLLGKFGINVLNRSDLDDIIKFMEKLQWELEFDLEVIADEYARRTIKATDH